MEYKSYSEGIFGKKINELTAQDLINFFKDVQEETDILEFKSGEVSLENIYKAISAFANTSGGILVIGAPEKKKSDDKEEYYQGSLIPCTSIKSKNRLLQKITNYVMPAPLGIHIKEIDYQQGKLFAIEIPQSKYPPHQVTTDGIYYLRWESESKAAPHSFVQALFNKRQYPNILSTITWYADPKEDIKWFQVRVENKSIITAKKPVLIVDIFGVKNLKYKNAGKSERIGDTIYVESSNVVFSTNDKYRFRFSSGSGSLVKGVLISYDFIVEDLKSNYLLSITTFSNNAEVKCKVFIVEPVKSEIIYELVMDTENTNKILADLLDKYKIQYEDGISYKEPE